MKKIIVIMICCWAGIAFAQQVTVDLQTIKQYQEDMAQAQDGISSLQKRVAQDNAAIQSLINDPTAQAVIQSDATLSTLVDTIKNPGKGQQVNAIQDQL